MERYSIRFDNFSSTTILGTRIAYVATNNGIGFGSVRYCSVYKTHDNQYVCSLVEHIDGLSPAYKAAIYISREGILDFFGKTIVGYRIMWLVSDAEMSGVITKVA